MPANPCAFCMHEHNRPITHEPEWVCPYCGLSHFAAEQAAVLTGPLFPQPDRLPSHEDELPSEGWEDAELLACDAPVVLIGELLDLVYHAEWVLRANGWHRAGSETGGPALHAKLAKALANAGRQPK